MRYLSLLFFIFFSLCSGVVFAQDPPAPSCKNTLDFGCSTLSSAVGSNAHTCYNGGYLNPSFRVRDASCGGYPGKRSYCDYNCSCPVGFKLNITISPVTGQNQTTCAPDEPIDGGEECEHGVNPETGLCNNDDACPSGYPKVNGQCPICPEYNSDGTCANPSSEPASSAPNSSSPDTGSSGSAGSAGSAGGGGGDDGGGSPGGGGGDGGNGGNNGGGSGSAASASASSAAGTGSSSGTNNSWNPYSGYGNWIPISPDSPCPNKYQDVSGQWWCAGNTGGGNSSGNAGSAGSAASVKSAGPCDPTQRDYLQCISTGGSSANSVGSSSSSSAASNSAGSASSLGEKGEFDGEESEKKLEELEEELNQKIDDIKTEIQNEFASAISGNGTIQDFCKNIRGSEVCFGMQKFESWLDPISQAIFLVACVLSFSIVLTGRN